MPVSTASPGITFGASPAWMLPIVTTAGCSGSIRRETMCCRLPTSSAAAATVSTAVWGSPACPPRPVSVSLKKSAAAMNGPGTAATLPYSSGVHRWQP